jgi:hypothetical protein
LVDLDIWETPIREMRSPQTMPEFDMMPDVMTVGASDPRRLFRWLMLVE